MKLLTVATKVLLKINFPQETQELSFLWSSCI